MVVQLLKKKTRHSRKVKKESKSRKLGKGVGGMRDEDRLDQLNVAVEADDERRAERRRLYMLGLLERQYRPNKPSKRTDSLEEAVNTIEHLESEELKRTEGRPALKAALRAKLAERGLEKSMKYEGNESYPTPIGQESMPPGFFGEVEDFDCSKGYGLSGLLESEKCKKEVGTRDMPVVDSTMNDRMGTINDILFGEI